jgi:hypothetical protein
MRRSVKISAGIFFILFVLTVAAMGAEIFGPRKYVRTEGATDIYTETFKAGAGPGKMIIRNGAPDGGKRAPDAVSSARVVLNGAEIFTPDDFSRTKYDLEAQIDLDASNTLTVELGSRPGNFLAISIEQENSSPVTVSITSPGNGAAIGSPYVTVQGTLTTSSENEVGVAVNGVSAWVNGNSFASNHVPLQEGENTLTAVATDSLGNTSTASISVDFSPDELYIHLTADKESGVSPFTTTLKVEGSFPFTAPIPVCTGPGTVGIVRGAGENEFDVSFTTPGIYRFTSVVEVEGKTCSDTVAVCVMNQAELDALLRAEWNAMKAFLVAGDIDGAMTLHQKAVHEKYSAIYSALGSELPALVQQMNDISPVFFDDGLAKYRIRQDHDINGQVRTITYYLYFSRDDKGLWRIENY